MPVIERAIETAALMLGSDRSRGYCLEMICADFLAGANLDHGDPEMLLFSMTRFLKFLPGEQRQAFLTGLGENASTKFSVSPTDSKRQLLSRHLHPEASQGGVCEVAMNSLDPRLPLWRGGQLNGSIYAT
jgi:hypothetical protein